jgi:hypothetical protein
MKVGPGTRIGGDGLAAVGERHHECDRERDSRPLLESLKAWLDSSLTKLVVGTYTLSLLLALVC